MHSTNYIIVFILILTASVAVALTGLREATKAQAELNEDIFNKRAILSAVEDFLPDNKKVKELSDQDVVSLFQDQVEQLVLDTEGKVKDGLMAEDIDMAKEKKKSLDEQSLPLYVYFTGSEKFYILSVRGNGLWDEIWGNIALKSDMNTVVGAAFDHKGETPGLGAEIKDNPTFAAQFKGKEIYKAGEFVSVNVRKGGAKDKMHEVDGISGATVTANGVSEMLFRGIKYYEPYLKSESQSGKTQGLLLNK